MPTIPDDKLKAIHEAIFQNRKIEAIKIYRACTNKSLVDAKRTIDAFEGELRLTSPEKFGAREPAKGGGCQGVLVLLVGILALALIWWLVSK